MLKKLFGVGAVVAMAALAGFGVATLERQRKPARFKITVQMEAGIAKLVCHEGCVWTELTFPCGDPPECQSLFNGFGAVSQGPAIR